MSIDWAGCDLVAILGETARPIAEGFGDSIVTSAPKDNEWLTLYPVEVLVVTVDLQAPPERVVFWTNVFIKCGSITTFTNSG